LNSRLGKKYKNSHNEYIQLSLFAPLLIYQLENNEKIVKLSLLLFATVINVKISKEK